MKIFLNFSIPAGVGDGEARKERIPYLLKIICASGVTVGLKNWLRISTAVEYSSLDDGFRRIKAFYHRHAKKA